MAFSSDSVQVFLAALDHGSFSAAARALSRVPSAVSMTIAHLEAELAVQLFDRSGREPRPTAAARALEPQARLLAGQLQQLNAQALALTQGLEERLTLAIAPELLAQLAAALGLKARDVVAAQMLDNGSPWLGLLLDSPHTVLQLKPDQLALKNLGHKVGVVGIYPTEDAAPPLIVRSNREARAFGKTASPSAPEPHLEVRAFGAPVGILEDPVTGSLNASLAQWLMADGHLPDRYLATQGQALGRDGQVFLSRDATGQVWVGGDVARCINGQVML